MFALEWLQSLRRMLLAAAVPALIATMLFAGACGGGGDDDSGGSDGDEPTAEATDDSGDDDGSGDDDDGSGDDDDGDGGTTEVTVGETFWHSGFEVTVEDAAIETAESGGFSNETNYFAVINMTILNTGEDLWSFRPEMALQSGGNTYTQQSFQSEAPDVPGGLSSEATIAFVVDPEFSLDDATLIVGAGGENRAIVPLGPDGDELVALEPEDLTATGQINMQLITLDFTGGELRADFPRFHSEQDEGKLVLTLDLTATSRTGGNWNVFEQDFVLTSPDGNSSPPDSAVLGSLPGTEAGIVTEGLSLTFDVDDPAAGDYTLIFTPGSWFVGDDGVTEAEYTFTVE